MGLYPTGLEVTGMSEANAPQPSSDLISLKGLKSWAEDRLAPDHPLRLVLASEPEEMLASEFVSKIRGWTVLARSTQPAD